MDSHNSSKPPSSDGYKKAKKDRSLREKTGRKTGGQKGHKGVNMKLPHEPDEVKIHLPENVKPVLIFSHAQQMDMYLSVQKRDT